MKMGGKKIGKGGVKNYRKGGAKRSVKNYVGVINSSWIFRL
jgi:hypothetical protein